jgi:hypothetical protein
VQQKPKAMPMQPPRRLDLAAGTPHTSRRPTNRRRRARLLAGTIVALATMTMTPKAWAQG